MTNQQDTALLRVAEEAPWWRLKPGLSGLKRFMPDRIVQSAKAKGLGWIKHYEPVCADCPRIAAEQTKPSASCEAGEVERVALMDEAGHTADAVRDACRLVLGKIVTFGDSEKIAQYIVQHITALRANAPEAQAGERAAIVAWLKTGAAHRVIDKQMISVDDYPSDIATAIRLAIERGDHLASGAGDELGASGGKG